MSEIPWGIPVAVDLFFAGVGAGSFCLGAIASRKKGAGWEACFRMASLLAPLAVAIGLSMLIMDLRNKPRFWMTLTRFNASSPMSIGVWLLTAFFLVSLIFALYGLPESSRQRIPGIGRLCIWNQKEWKNRIGITGFPLALAVPVYTGALLSVSVIPLWRNPGLPLLFFLSSIATGFAGGALLGMSLLGRKNRDAMEEPLRFLKRSYRMILPFYLLMVVLLVSTLVISPVSRTDALNLLTGWIGFIWWAGVVGIGIIVPLILVLKKKAIELHYAWLLFSCLLIGGFLLRMVLVIAGQRSS
jgi:polysulfide reductase chain C